jgi:hypothetical protein
MRNFAASIAASGCRRTGGRMTKTDPARADPPDGASQEGINRCQNWCANASLYEIPGTTVTNRTDTNLPADVQLGFHHRIHPAKSLIEDRVWTTGS